MEFHGVREIPLWNLLNAINGFIYAMGCITNIEGVTGAFAGVVQFSSKLRIDICSTVASSALPRTSSRNDAA